MGGARFWPCPSLSKLYKGSFKFDEKGWLFVCFGVWVWCDKGQRRTYCPCPSIEMSWGTESQAGASQSQRSSSLHPPQGWVNSPVVLHLAFLCGSWAILNSAPVWGHLRTGSRTNQRLVSDLLCNQEWHWTQIILPPLPKYLDFCACSTTPSSCVIFENLVFSYKLGRGVVCVKFDFLFVCFLFSLNE